MTSVIHDDSEQELNETERQRLLGKNLSVNITFDQPKGEKKFDRDAKISKYFLNDEKAVEG